MGSRPPVQLRAADRIAAAHEVWPTSRQTARGGGLDRLDEAVHLAGVLDIGAGVGIERHRWPAAPSPPEGRAARPRPGPAGVGQSRCAAGIAARPAMASRSAEAVEGDA